MKMLRIVNDTSFYRFLGSGNTMEYLFLCPSVNFSLKGHLKVI